MIIDIAKRFLLVDSEGKQVILDYYNQHCYNLVAYNRRYKIKPSDEWCACFVSAIAHMVGIKRGFPFEVSTIEQVKLGRKMGTFFTDIKQAREGDLIFFDWDLNGQPNHVGFFVENKAGEVKTLEGNKDKTVCYRLFSANSKYVYGFIRTPIPEAIPLEKLAGDTIRGVYGYGDVRKQMLGERYQAVQDLVNLMLSK